MVLTLAISGVQIVQSAGFTVPDIGDELAGLRVLDPAKTVEDGVPLLLDECVDDCLDRAHWGVVRLLLPVTGGRELAKQNFNTGVIQE